MMHAQEIIARRVALELREGMLVNLGIGLPTMVANHIPAGLNVFLQSENGLIGLDARPPEGMEDGDLTDAGGGFVTAIPGATRIDSVMSFGLIRGGHLDITVLGGLQVDAKGLLANWMIPGVLAPGMGGAMDLVTGAKQVIVAMQHTAKDGASKIVPECTWPLTSIRPVNCKHVITLSEVYYIVSKEFYEKYSAAPPEKLGLDRFMSHYDQTLQNAPSQDPTYGLEYHHSVCPFCLQFESRDSGCSYMVHENTKHEPSSHAPFCDARLQIKELVDKYKAVSDVGEAATHLEFCAECGRPCVNHAHIGSAPPYTTIAPAMRMLPDGRQERDYATCTGGGRAELFARILAIRKVYREGGILDPMDERKAAAKAADNAPNDPELMAQGAAIFAQEEASRHWTNAPIPLTKRYDDPAYRSGDSNSNSNNNNSNNDMQRGGKGRTYKHTTTQKKRKHAKKTRKH